MKLIAAAVFTTNRVAAAPVHWSREVIKDGRTDAVVLNSGGANACTGPQGFQNTHTTAEKTAEALGSQRPNDRLVAVGKRSEHERQSRRHIGVIEGGLHAGAHIDAGETHRHGPSRTRW